MKFGTVHENDLAAVRSTACVSRLTRCCAPLLNRLLNFRRQIFLLLCAATTSCTVGPNYKRPPQQMPIAYKSATTQEAPQPQLSQQWWRLFGDQTLDSLEADALESNTDIRAAIARVTQARAAAQIIGSQFYPVVTLDPSIVRSRTPGNSNNNNSNNTNNTSSGRARTANVVRVPFDLSYEVDIWGRIRRAMNPPTPPQMHRSMIIRSCCKRSKRMSRRIISTFAR